MLEQGHNPILILASLAIALMAGFTGLSLTQGASAMEIWRRKIVVAMSAVALGSGIWSMHFVAMLGLRLPVPFFYDALTTMISAFVAILLTGLALLVVHFGERTPQRIALAGVFTGAGISAMHYIGMSGIQTVRPVYSTFGIGLAIASALVLCVASFWISYGHRESRNILLGTIGFGISVVAVHYIAMAGTGFVVVEGVEHTGYWLSNEALAFGVTFSSFIISAAFLLVGVTFAARIAQGPGDTPQGGTTPMQNAAPTGPPPATNNIPFEKDGRTHFVPDDEVFAVRAEGRYTIVYHKTGRLFCPWSISEFEKRGVSQNLIKCHRSYLVNPKRVSSFERKKDNGVCHFEPGAPLDMLPVSRSYLKEIRDRLGV